MMPAHIKFSTVDPDNIVTFSSVWKSKINEIGFNGVLMSDCLSMKGVGD